ncbi:hypothetical protein QZH36_14720 [Erwinia sp. BC051422]|uniref:hypothetical protein n=1 Tax=Erwinia wuhanensis TaxID=3045167 RepID=UPI00264BE166|nr:hypothetical protein [Erwinia sp. BC051422]MDN8542675.1 hypothetical protein [Erwinia sp. BC051422]
MMDYSLYYRNKTDLNGDWPTWDLFISAYNLSDRVSAVFNKADANNKYWLIYPEYKFDEDELPTNATKITAVEGNEAQQLASIIDGIKLYDYVDKRICIDSTGFMRPQLLFIMLLLQKKSFKHVDIIYSEPDRYINKENTTFSNGAIYETRTIIGFDGTKKIDNDRALLIIAAGYDTKLISKIAQYNENTDIIHLIGFPSLRADMFQENIIKAISSADSSTENVLAKPIFSPAADPFETARDIENYISINGCIEKYGHIYLCPLSTKAQTIGMGLAYLNTYSQSNVSIIYPFTDSYSKGTSVGISNLWIYTLEF